mgnify:CR=1 FL=1
MDIAPRAPATRCAAAAAAAVLVLLAGGVIVDKWGTVKSTILFGGICAAAGVLNAVSSELYVMLGARFLLGVGAEPLIVAITCALAKWFKGKELAFAFGVNLTIARLGSYAADLSPTWASTAYEGGWQPPLVVAAVIGGLRPRHWAALQPSFVRYAHVMWGFAPSLGATNNASLHVA